MRKLSLILGCALLSILTGCFGAAPDGLKRRNRQSPSSRSPDRPRFTGCTRWSGPGHPTAQVLKMNSIHLLEVPLGPRTGRRWEATFCLPPAKDARGTYTYFRGRVAHGNLHQGVFAGPEEDLNAQAQPFSHRRRQSGYRRRLQNGARQSGRLRQEEPAHDHLHGAREGQTVPEIPPGE